MKHSTIVFCICIFVLLLTPSPAQADICGCEGHPDSLGAFDAGDPATYPEGSISGYYVVTIPLPADGVLIFTDFTMRNYAVKFQHNDANTPVTLLISGNATISNTLNLNGENGQSGSVGGLGGKGGPGGFRGGEGVDKRLNGNTIGGAGSGPGGGLGLGGANTDTHGNTPPYWTGASAGYVGSSDMMPLIGGSGGGGGTSSENEANCHGGGGGGGGGAILIAVNGTLAITGSITANGGAGGSYWSSTCSGGGGGGSGGAIRLIAHAISGSGTVYANGGSAGAAQYSDYGERGVIRMEADTNTLLVSGPATRLEWPGPLSSLTAVPTVKITNVHGQVVSATPVGVFGRIDVYVDAVGTITVDLETTGVQQNTEIIVTAKPKVGADPFESTVVNDPSNCNQAGVCSLSTSFTLDPGIYYLEAEATFILATQ